MTPDFSIWDSIDELRGLAGPIHLALGVFDGVHVGHQAVIGAAVQSAKKEGGRAGVLTFEPHPIQFLAPERAPRRILASLHHKYELFQRFGASFVVALPFDQARAFQSAEAFVAELNSISALKHLAAGEDWQFGHERGGDMARLQEWFTGEKVSVIPPVMRQGERVSSTRIRQAIRDGRIDRASEMLGWPYAVKGEVMRGQQLGRTIGFPTANLDVDNEQLPPDGVWVVQVKVRETVYQGVSNIGTRPTVSDQNRRKLEVYLFEFFDEIYGEYIEVEFLKMLRKEMAFSSVEELTIQIRKDVEQAQKFLEP